MTTFEGLILLAVFTAVIIIAVGIDVIVKKLKEIIDKQYANWETLSEIRGDTVDIFRELNNIEDNILDVCNQQQGAWACDVTTIVKGVNELTDIVDKMHRNLCVEIADKMVDRVYKQPISVNGTPCYAPDGICTNPFRDCINCPKKEIGGTWTTSTNTIKEE